MQKLLDTLNYSQKTINNVVQLVESKKQRKICALFFYCILTKSGKENTMLGNKAYRSNHAAVPEWFMIIRRKRLWKP